MLFACGSAAASAATLPAYSCFVQRRRTHAGRTHASWHAGGQAGPLAAARPPGLQVGSDMAAGEVVLQAGQHIGAAEVGILATVGATAVR